MTKKMEKKKREQEKNKEGEKIKKRRQQGLISSSDEAKILNQLEERCDDTSSGGEVAVDGP